jgi:hypothetical protein
MNTLSRSRSVVSRLTIRNFLMRNSHISPAFSCVKLNPTRSSDMRKMSTSVQQDVYEPMFFSSSLSPQILDTYSVVGEEMQLKEALKEHDKFDKFVILVAHGETASTIENESSLSSLNDISLSGKVSYTLHFIYIFPKKYLPK